jgi:hypothetical protein
MLDRIMLFAMETGLVTAGLALTLCLSWAFMPKNEVWNGVLMVYTRMNANAVLVSLNARNLHRGQNSSSVHAVSGVASGQQISLQYTREVTVQMDDFRQGPMSPRMAKVCHL